MGELKQLQAADGHRFDAYRADAAGAVKGSVVVLQEAFGVNAHIRALCDDYARRGYHAVAPALYDRQRRNAAFGYDAEGLEQARALRRGLDYEKVLLDVEAVAASSVLLLSFGHRQAARRATALPGHHALRRA
jgi:carboxymethylenebutenolidase